MAHYHLTDLSGKIRYFVETSLYFERQKSDDMGARCFSNIWSFWW